MSGNNLNLNRNASEGKNIRNTNPVNMSSVPDNLLKAASPASFNLLQNTKINKDSSDAAAAACRSYTDIAGLRRLKKDQVNMTYYDPRCGWRYKPSNGLIPEINQAALGTAAGPSFGEPGSPDEVVGGAQWFWDLESAERTITAKICQNASRCSQLSMLGRYADVCGYCKTTGAIIPITAGASTYPNDTAFACLKKDIVTSSGTCPAENFTNFRQGNLKEAFKVREGFGTLDALNNCMEMPLARDCVIRAAQNAGCSSDGALIRALKDSTGSSYDSKLNTNAAYSAYSSFTPFSPGLMQDGSVASINVALNDFGNLMGNTQSTNLKKSLAARDLCLREGEFDNYDFCTEMTGDTIINANNISCAQKVWEQRGGTKQGTKKPTVAALNGRNFGDFMMGLLDYLLKIESNDKNVNVDGIMNVFGSDTSARTAAQGTDLPMNENTRGAETVWFDLGNVRDAQPRVIIMRCDLRLRKDTSTRAGPAGEVLPFITTATDVVNKYNFINPNNKAYTSAFEIRITDDTSVSFGITTDDGFMISKNQNPFENAGGGPDWGSWTYQGPTDYYSPAYNINAGQPNVFVTKWFQGYGEATSKFWIYRPKTDWVKGALSPDVYLTQEPLAPWCQYEICSKPNNGAGKTVGLFEKRWNGPSGMNEQRAPTSGFDVTAENIVFQTDPKLREGVPGQKGYASFVSNSSWATKSYFHFNAFRTITLLIRPVANLADGGFVPIFSQAHAATTSIECARSGRTIMDCYPYSVDLILRKDNGVYKLMYAGRMWSGAGQSGPYIPQVVNDVAMNEWNLVVIQYVGDGSGIRKFTCNVESLSSVQSDSGRASLLTKLNAGRSGGSIILGNRPNTPLIDSGVLTLGAPNLDRYMLGRTSFTGDVAWIHGFRNYLDTDALLKKEITQTWISRWPTPNLPEDTNGPVQTVYGNNGTVTCETYCGGVNGGSWNGELPASWNGARCIGSPGNSAGCFSTAPNQINCACTATGAGWRQGTPW